VTGKKEYKQKVNLPLSIKNELVPIFKDLSSESLLSKCLHGLTQNANEALNNIIWKKCPKNIFMKKDTLNMAVSLAIIDFNEGKIGICHVAKELGLDCGRFMASLITEADESRVRGMARKSNEKDKKRRKKLRAIRKGFEDEEKTSDGKHSYHSGGF